MTLIRFNTPETLKHLNTYKPFAGSLFNDFFRPDLFNRELSNYSPAVNVKETENAFVLDVSAPGYDKDDFNVGIENGVLTISGEHKTEKKEEEKNYQHREFTYGSFSRSFTLSDEVDEDKVDAKYEKGILQLTLHKKQLAPAPTMKQVKVS